MVGRRIKGRMEEVMKVGRLMKKSAGNKCWGGQREKGMREGRKKGEEIEGGSEGARVAEGWNNEERN